MEQKESKVLGLPVALIFFVAALVLFIDGFSWFFVKAPIQKSLSRIENKLTVTPVVTASPSASLAPTEEPTATPAVLKSFKRVVAPTVAR